MNCLGDRIRYIRHKRDLTIDQLAELTGLSYGSIRAYEHSDRYPNTCLLYTSPSPRDTR